ncbi:RluA family pseudouridine synthase [Patescibacteria group bacterium]|jgi:23S rRNA pseudouridine1911/1915/1917 synthase|nr:RluA family pseudouridine synthase [Patescibacteria group bacterium]
MDSASGDTGSDLLTQVGILFEDADCVVIDKPAGLMVHADGRSEGATVVDWFLTRYPKAAGVGEAQYLPSGEEIMRPGVVHRLDADTSGVLVLAKTHEAHAHLKAQFQGRTMEKEYLAFVWGGFNVEGGTIDKPIGRASGKGPPRWSAGRDAKGTLREALTHYTVLHAGKEHSLVALFPKTGRTHQLRVHLKAIDHPLVCDRLYAPKRPCVLGFQRLALHARRLTFLAVRGERVTVEAPLPEDFLAARARLCAAA